ncbi:hypothetical protein TNCV_3667281 [Trichonephila clavipes]|nr:hypothetical protein TNCV_3667281 [Trichonephila clavipes]
MGWRLASRAICPVICQAPKAPVKMIPQRKNESKENFWFNGISGASETKPLRKPNSRFGRRVSITSNSNWSDRTDSTSPPSNSTTVLGANSPSRVTIGDEYIAEKSDIFREAICARNVYAAWARKMTNARPNDPKLQNYHQEVTKAGETVNSFLKQLDVPLFKIPASEKELDKILLRLKNKVNDPPDFDLIYD